MKRVKKNEAICQLARGITKGIAHCDKNHPKHLAAVHLAYILWQLATPLKSGRYCLDDMDISDLIREFNK